MWEYLSKKIVPSRAERESSDIHAARSPASPEQEGRVEIRDDEHRHPGYPGQRPRKRGRNLPGHKHRTLKCPVCRVKMKRLYVGNVEIDECPDCQGIFLDRGELRALGVEEKSTYERSGQGEKEVLVYTPHGLSNNVMN